MIYISAHKDFDLKLKQETINKLKDDLCIIDGGELKNSYPIPIIHETELNNDIYNLHDFYADLTRMYYIYKNIDKYNDDNIGFIQYRRSFVQNTLIDSNKILKTYDIIIPNCYCFSNETVIDQYNKCHIKGLLNDAFNILYEINNSYENIINRVSNNNFIIAHNMFIMKKNDFIKYCEFLFPIFKIFSEKHNLKTYNDYLKFINNNPTQLKIYSFLAERISNIFYFTNFNIEKIYFSPIIQL